MSSSIDQYNRALQAVQKRLHGKKLNYLDVLAIMDEIVNDPKFHPVLTTYFAASGYVKKFSREEIYYLTKAMVKVGSQINFKGEVIADKHSIGGLAGSRTTLIIVPLLASLGIKMLATPSRAITTPSGTADDMEILANVKLSIDRVKELIKTVGACIVWGGYLQMAPADDKLIQVEKPLFGESMDKALVSIMAKKVASGATHVVVEIPIGKDMKLHGRKDGDRLGRDFVWLANKFGIKLKPVVIPTHQPAGAGVGPILETREALRVLQAKPNQDMRLRNRALLLADNLLALTMRQPEIKKRMNDLMAGKFKSLTQLLQHQLDSGLAWAKMQEIIKAQGGRPDIDSEDLKPRAAKLKIKADKAGVITRVMMKNISKISRILGAPKDVSAGVELNKSLGEEVKQADDLVVFYSSDKMKLKEAEATLKFLPIYKINN